MAREERQRVLVIVQARANTVSNASVRVDPLALAQMPVCAFLCVFLCVLCVYASVVSRVCMCMCVCACGMRFPCCGIVYGVCMCFASRYILSTITHTHTIQKLIVYFVLLL
jgi:hypothetical protein